MDYVFFFVWIFLGEGSGGGSKKFNLDAVNPRSNLQNQRINVGEFFGAQARFSTS